MLRLGYVLIVFSGLHALVAAQDATALNGTKPLEATGDLSLDNLERVDRYLLSASITRRSRA